MKKDKLKNIIEAALMVSDQPLSIARLLALFEKDVEQPDRNEIKAAIDELQQDYEGHAVEIKEVASGYRVQVCNKYAEWINRLYDERPPRYSRALLETLAIIAYRQPLTRAEIEDIRGVSVSSSIVKTLQEREWIRVVGHRDVPGKPELLATTKEFLDYFNLKKLSDLPTLAEIKDYEQILPDLFGDMENEDITQQDTIQNIKKEDDQDNLVDNNSEIQLEEQQGSMFLDDDKVVPFTH